MAADGFSVVLPVQDQEGHIRGVVESHLARLDRLPVPVEILLVANAASDRTEAICADLAARHSNVRHLSLERPGAGRAYRDGLANARGEWLCIANSARTTSELLAEMASEVLRRERPLLLMAKRTGRRSPYRRVASFAYSLECRLFLGLRWRDVNGTPKIFPRTFTRLLDLRSDGDEIDAELLYACVREGYPVVEWPIPFPARHEGRSTTGVRTGLRMYAAVPRMRRRRP
jgi:glycosyltransferase involved in cell wall biosynthesis